MTKTALLAGALAGMLIGCSSEDGDLPGTTGGSPGVGGTASGGTTSGGGRGGSAGANGGSPSSAGRASGGSPGAAGTGGSAGASTGGSSGTGGSAGGGGQSGGGGMAAGGSGGMSGTSGGQAGAGGRGGAGAASGAGGAAGAGATSGAGGSAVGGQGGSGAGGTAGASGGLPFGNPAVPSAGCGKTSTVTNGKKTITSSGQQRTYIIDIPSSYDANEPYRLFYTSHWIGSTSEAVRDQNYYFLKPLADAAGEPAIFVAPQSDGSTWQEKDHALFDDILAYVKTNLCIDTTRVFATGFSFGGMITYSLSVNHQKDIRAAVGIAPANYNIYVPPKNHEPIAWMQTTGMGDTTCPWVNGNSTTQGAKFIAIEHATDNGCMVPSSIPTWQQGNHVCYDFMGCGASYPTKVCTFNGGHTNIANDPNSNTNWIPQESWNFFKQF